MLLVISSIIFIALLAIAFNLNSSFKVCPICAGVSLTWLWLLAGLFLVGWFGFPSDPLIIAILMGGSVVGLAYAFDKKNLTGDKKKYELFWNLIFIPTGFAAVYYLLNFKWKNFFLADLIMLSTYLYFLHLARRQKSNDKVNPAIKELEDKLKDCC